MKLARTLVLAVGCLFAASTTQLEVSADTRLEAASAGSQKAFHLGGDNYLCFLPCWWGECCEKEDNGEEGDAEEA